MTRTTGADASRPISQRVVEKVATATGQDPLEMEQLYERVDPDGLNQLFADVSSEQSRDQGYVAFPLAGCQVMVHADGTVEVTPKADSSDAPATDTQGEPSSHALDSSRAAESPD